MNERWSCWTIPAAPSVSLAPSHRDPSELTVYLCGIGREGEREGWREGEREGGREGGRERGRERGREGEREREGGGRDHTTQLDTNRRISTPSFSASCFSTNCC